MFKPSLPPDIAEELDFALLQQICDALGCYSGSQDYLEILSELERSQRKGLLTAWRQNGPLERYCRKYELDPVPVYTTLLQEWPAACVDLSVIGFIGPVQPIPPLLTPLLPICKREGEITVASYVPGINRLLEKPQFVVLNAFWGVERINAVWADPEDLRTALEAPRGVDRNECKSQIKRDQVANGGMPWVDLSGVTSSAKLNQWFSPTLQRRFQACPIYRAHKTITLAVTAALSAPVKAEIEGILRHRFSVQTVLADAEPIRKLVTTAESRSINPLGMVEAISVSDHRSRQTDVLEVIHADRLARAGRTIAEADQAVIRFVQSILYKAVDLGASDIMFQEFPERLRVRYKVDGEWFDEQGQFPAHVAKQVISRVKVISGLEIQFVRVPQDGTFPIKIGDQRYDFRVNTSYHAQGEQAVLRLQRDHRSVKSLADLDVPEHHIRAIDHVMHGDHGLLVLCGPTGSGKTTTIYSILNSLDATSNNILTAESPIEVFLPDISQTQIDDESPYNFATWARGILRQAPDVVMMGEIRDEESLDALMRLSSSGHRAISTLHTNSAAEVPSRFFVFGAQPFMVADSLKLVLAQRLVKRVCPRCAIEEPVPTEERLCRLGIPPDWLPLDSIIRRGRACDLCRHTGIRGRKAIFEALIVDQEVQAAIQDRAPTREFRRIMASRGEPTLFQAAVAEAAKGIITIEEACKFRELGVEAE
jgi:type II secretory ATPase GspE/PulE/Tfp pilus assembly ATPase PilB-like protein